MSTIFLKQCSASASEGCTKHTLTTSCPPSGIGSDARVWSGLGFRPGSDWTGPRVQSHLGSSLALGLRVQFRVHGGLGMVQTWSELNQTLNLMELEQYRKEGKCDV